MGVRVCVRARARVCVCVCVCVCTFCVLVLLAAPVLHDDWGRAIRVSVGLVPRCRLGGVQTSGVGCRAVVLLCVRKPVERLMTNL